MTTSTPVEAVAGAPTSFTTKPVNIVSHFKAYKEGDKGYKDLVAMVEAGIITDEATEIIVGENDKKEVTYKRKSLTHTLDVVDLVAVLADTPFSLQQVTHMQELVIGAVKKEVQKLVSDTTRTAPLTNADIPSWESVLAAPFAKRAVAVKVTMDMVKAATATLVAYLKDNGVREGGVALAESLCLKKFSLTALNSQKLPVIEKVQGLVNGWFESLEATEQHTHLDVMDLWTTAIDAKLNPQQEDKAIDDLF